MTKKFFLSIISYEKFYLLKLIKMSQKDLLNEIRQEMKDLKAEEKEKLEDLKKSWLPKEEIEKRRKEIIETFSVKREELKQREWYEEAIKAARHQWYLRWKILESAHKIKKLKNKLRASEFGDRVNEVEEEIAKKNELLKELLDLYRQSKHERDDKPGSFVDVEINWVGSLLEKRTININGKDIEFIISTAKKRRLIVDDCQIRDSFKIKDPQDIAEFIDKVIFNYPDLINVRKTIWHQKEWEKKNKEIANSYKLEWLAHNLAYVVFNFFNFKPEKNDAYHKLIKFLIKSAEHADLDDEERRKQILFDLWWLFYKILPDRDKILPNRIKKKWNDGKNNEDN